MGLFFIDNYNEIIDKHIPEYIAKNGAPPKTKWMNRSALDAIKVKDDAWKYYRKYTTQTNREKYVKDQEQC